RAVRIPAIDRPGERLVAAGVQVAEVQLVVLVGAADLLPDRRGLSRARDVGAAGVGRTGVRLTLRRPVEIRGDLLERAVVLLARRGLVLVVPAPRRVRGRVGAHAERPAVERGLVQQVPLADAGRRALGDVRAVVVAVLAHAHDARVLRV